MTTRVGWAVVGCGWVARDYVIPAIQASGNGQLLVGCDPAPAARDWLGGQGIPATADVADAVGWPGVEAVYVATPNHAHRAAVEVAAAAGKAVLCEKPLAATRADAEALVGACRGVIAGAAFDQRYHAAHRQLARLIGQGRLGVITQARIHYACWVAPDWAADNWRADPTRAGGGAALDLAPHGIDLLEMLLGEPWAELHALTQRRIHPYPVDDGAVLMGRLASGTLATLQVAYNCPETYPRRTLELIGTAAHAVCVDTMGQTPGGTLTLTDAPTGHATAIPLDDDVSPFMRQVEAFAACVGAGRPYPFGLADDLRKYRLLDAALNATPNSMLGAA